MEKIFMNEISFKETIPGADEYFELFSSTGWNDKYNFTKTELAGAINNSWYAVAAYFKNELVGFGRVISDGFHHALIVDMIIAPEYQGKGIGSEVLKIIIAKCTKNNIRDIQLFSAKNKSGFYEKFSFIKRPAEAPGMQYNFKSN